MKVVFSSRVSDTTSRLAQPAPSPLAGEGCGGGYVAISAPTIAPPSRLASLGDLPRKGGGEAERAAPSAITVAGVDLIADPLGALYWPDEGLLVVSDLHLEKGSSLAARGVLVPPFDTAATLAVLGELIARYAPRLVVALGDSFHDGEGPARIAPADRAALFALQRRRDWLWIAGNHDPDPAEGIGGHFAEMIAIGALTFRHAPGHNASEGEIAGHLHPLARIARRGRVVSRRCFACDGKRMIMPALGAYAGGLNVRDAAFLEFFDLRAFTAHLLGERRLYAIRARNCLPD